jgi:hypothetical protein
MTLANNPTELAHLDTLKPGDTVIVDGVAKTLGREYLSHCSFMGTSIYGDCRAQQGCTVPVVLFPKWSKGELVGYVRQI